MGTLVADSSFDMGEFLYKADWYDIVYGGVLVIDTAATIQVENWSNSDPAGETFEVLTLTGDFSQYGADGNPIGPITAISYSVAPAFSDGEATPPPWGTFTLSDISISVSDFLSYIAPGFEGNQDLTGLFEQLLQGADHLTGGASADGLMGFDGNDVIDGGAGNDFLIGGSGSDTLTGGAGNDTFYGTTAELSGDTITDFSAGDSILFTDASLSSFTFSLSGHTLTYSGGSLTLTDVPDGKLVASAAANGGVQIEVQHVAANDFNGDGRSDVLWRNTSTGDITDWIANSDGSFSGNTLYAHQNASSNWTVIGTGDFNGDGHYDILWRNSNGTITDWLGDANGGFTGNLAHADNSVTSAWTAIATGDFNGDGRTDVLWQNSSTGVVTDWLGQANGSFVGNSAANNNIGSAWQVVGTGDVNGDGIDDVIWRNTSTGDITDWLGQANGSFTGNTQYAHQNASLQWHAIGVGDFNGDGMTDILWRNDNGTVTDWLGNANGGFTGNLAHADNSIGSNWQAIGVGDFNGDTHDDVLWQNTSTGVVTDWLSTASGGFAGNTAPTNDVSSVWHVQPHEVLV